MNDGLIRSIGEKIKKGATIPPQRLRLLQDMPLFGGINENTLHYLLAHVPIVTMPKGGLFFKEGDDAKALYVLERGRVDIFKSLNGKDYRIRSLEKKDCFGEMALMDLRPRSATVEALEDCTALEISYVALHDIYQLNLEQYTLIQMNMGREVSRRLRDADQLLFELKISMGHHESGKIFKGSVGSRVE